MSTCSSLWNVGLLLCVGCAGQPQVIVEPTLEQAQAAYAKLDLDLSRRILEKLLEDPAASLEDQVRAEQKLARQEWKFHGDLTVARARLARADACGVERFESWLLLSRIEREAGNLDEARAAAYEARQLARSDSQAKDAWIEFAKAVLEQAGACQRESCSQDYESQTEASAQLVGILDQEPGHREASSLLLGLALLLDDGPTALRAWRSYYHVPQGQSAQGLMNVPGQTLDRLLPTWEKRCLTRSEQEELVVALAQSRLFRHAALLARKAHCDGSPPLVNLPQVAEVVAYSEFLDRAKTVTDEFYRLTALGRESKAAYEREWNRAAQALWDKLPFEGPRPAFTSRSFEEQLGQRFGAYLNFGRVSGYYGLAFGHRVVDQTRTIRQYNHEVKLRFVALDSMVSNFYTSWFWDGESAVGGWAKPSTIYQVRSAYADEPFRAWRVVTDPDLRREIEEEIAENRASDDALAAENPYTYLSGLDQRLRLCCLDRLLASVKAKGYEGPQLCLAFVAEYERMELESSIFAHEGRHAIDETLHPTHFNWRRLRHEGFGAWSQAEKEFRAKLSEIAFAPDPQMAFQGAVFGRDIGGQTGHGQANQRIVKGIVEWMAAHRSEIAGLDANRPLLPQFDLLTFQQIRTAVRGMDPLASGIE